jgi:hypothetical protein
MNARASEVSFERTADYDYTDDDIDWEDIIESTQADVDAGRYAFSTEDYATHEEGMAALWKWMCSLGQGGSDETDHSASDTAGA